VPIRKQNAFRWDVAELEAAVTTKTKAILLNSPQNPTGTVHTMKDLQDICDVAIKHDLFVLSDEVYERVTWSDRKHICIASLPGMKERTISINSLTKSFCMGGWRIGYVYADTILIDQMEKLQQHLITSSNSFVQAGAAMAFGSAPQKQVLEFWRDWEDKCAFFTSEINALDGLNCAMPEGGFYAWVDISGFGQDSETFARNLLEKEKVAVIPGSAFGPSGEGYLRITCVRRWPEVKEGLARISRFIQNIDTA